MSAALHPQVLHDEAGLRLTGVDAEVSAPADWSSLLRPGMAHLILNLDGDGVALGERIRLGLVPNSASLLRLGEGETLHASRLPRGGRQRFLVWSAAISWLEEGFGPALVALNPLLQPAPLGPRDQIGQLRSMTLAERDLCEAILQPPVARALRPVWFRAKGLECFSLFAAAPQNESGHRPNDPLRRRIDEATVWLREHFRDDLDLLAVSRHVGCAPHYLSRLFKQHSGKTLSQKLRQIRIDHAAVLLRDGSCNVTEAALEVGYNSLSHFTKAFVAEKGIRPSDWRSR